jgi:hypothetical protein
MIDDYSKALALTERMKKLLPFPVRASKILVKMLEDKGSKLKLTQGIQVIDLLSSGDSLRF